MLCQLKVIYTDIVLEYPPLRVVHLLPKGVGRKLRFPFFLLQKRSHGRPQIYCKTGIKLSKVKVLRECAFWAGSLAGGGFPGGPSTSYESQSAGVCTDVKQ